MKVHKNRTAFKRSMLKSFMNRGFSFKAEEASDSGLFLLLQFEQIFCRIQGGSCQDPGSISRFERLVALYQDDCRHLIVSNYLGRGPGLLTSICFQVKQAY